MFIKVSLIGCGRISKRHAELLGKGHIKGAILHSVCDIDEKKAKQLGTTFDVPYFTNMHQMIQKTEPDLLVVLTESGNHAKHVLDIIKYKRNIIVEKPMALNVNDAEKMIEECDIAGVRLFVIKQNRFNLPIVKLRKAVEEGRFGKFVLGTTRVRWCRNQDYYDEASWRGTYKMDGGVLSNQASHHIDMLLWMMGDVDYVNAIGATQLVNIEAEDTAVVNLKFKNGALGIIEATTATRPSNIEGSISILGENGIVEVGGFAMNEIKHWQFNDNYAEEDIMQYSVNPPNVYGFGHKEYYDHVVDSILNNGPNLIDGISGKKSVELISAIYESMKSKKVVNMGYNSL